MRLTKLVFTIIFLLSFISYGQKKIIIKPQKELLTELDSVSYILGLNMAKSFKENMNELNSNVFTQGFLNEIDATDLLVSYDENEINSFLGSYFKKKKAQESEAQKKVNEDFLLENKTKENVVTTASGLQYIVLKEGTGVSPMKNSKVKVHYHGTLIDGTVFDSSVDRGEPIDFNVSQVIEGWTEGLQLMKVGSKFKFFIPQNLAYKERQAGKNIKPFSTLIFEVELLEIKQE